MKKYNKIVPGVTHMALLSPTKINIPLPDNQGEWNPDKADPVSREYHK